MTLVTGFATRFLWIARHAERTLASLWLDWFLYKLVVRACTLAKCSCHFGSSDCTAAPGTQLLRSFMESGSVELVPFVRVLANAKADM